MRTYDKFYINGQWVEPIGKGTNDVINPATGEISATVPYGNVEDVDAAVTAARNAFASWSQTSAATRADFLRKIAVEGEKRNADLTQTIIDELGMPIQNAAVFQVDPLAIICESFADKAKLMEEQKEVGNSLIVNEPIGVCAMINPWNYPIWQMIGKVAPAIAAGCTMVVKAASQTPSHLFIFAEICDAVGLPPGVFNMVHGSGREIGAAMSSHPEVDLVTFTGSTAAGIQVSNMAAPDVKRACLELGGKSPMVVFDDADIDAVVEAMRWSVFFNAGQVCSAGSRVYLQKGIYQQAIAKICQLAESFTLAPGLDPECEMGPVISSAQKDSIEGYIETGIKEGATVAYGGNKLDIDGYFVQPTVLLVERNDATVIQEEIFGPVVVLMPFEDEAQAIKLANDNIYGLAASVWTRDISRAMRCVRVIEAGTVWVNAHDLVDSAIPFGGFKQSGFGKDMGPEQLDHFLRTKAVWINV